MTRLAAIHPKWASRDERLGNDQASAAGEVHADDTKMVAPRWWPTAAPARKREPPQIQPGPQRWPSNCGGSRNQRHIDACSLVAVLATDRIRQPLLARAVTTAAWTFASVCQVSSTVVSVDEVPREVA
jgi:hypothetical protein